MIAMSERKTVIKIQKIQIEKENVRENGGNWDIFQQIKFKIALRFKLVYALNFSKQLYVVNYSMFKTALHIQNFFWIIVLIFTKLQHN